MPVPFEGGTTLPADANQETYWGLWNGVGYWAPRGTDKGMYVILYDAAGNALLTSANPGYTRIQDGHNVALGTTTDAEAAAGNGNAIQILKRLRTLLSSALAVTIAGGSSPIGATNDAEAAAGDGTAIAILKNIRTRLAGTLAVAITSVTVGGAGAHAAADTTFVATPAASGVLPGLGVTANLRFLGYAARETAGLNVTARFRITHGDAATDSMLATCGLVPNESREEFYGTRGKKAQDGIYLDVLAGTFELSVFTAILASS